jgi:alkylation response protein AidB-like acyl-CoA dehydrogenase
VDTSDANAPQIVHAFLPRDTPGYHIEETWDTLGMRATHSDDTILEGAFVPDKYIVRVGYPDRHCLR